MTDIRKEAGRNEDGNRFVERYERDAVRLQEEAHVETDGRDACGVGLIAAIDGKPSRQVVEAGIEALKALWHRGAVDADGMTGDGAGILVEIPQEAPRGPSARWCREPGGSPRLWSTPLAAR